ncbi:MAG: hypothetical protein ACI9CF_000996 [Candidatus Omnitrophota bacterium]|jgi:hypothetical protein
MWTKFVPWRYIVKKAAKKHNVLDPFEIFSQINRFAQPADVVAPSELLRAGFAFHTRGLINSQAIQHNLDWVWPYWVERQFDPKDKAFIPRAFSLTHVNLTHRNWTALGLPDSKETPIVDPRGLLTPFWDGWSIDCWMINDDKETYVPSRANSNQVSQELKMDKNLAIVTNLKDQEVSFATRIKVLKKSGNHVCQLAVKGLMPKSGWIVVSLRPFNPEGVSFVKRVAFLEKKNEWLVDNKYQIQFEQKPDQNITSSYRHGDVYSKVCKHDFKEVDYHKDCHTGMTTAAALFRIEANQAKEIRVDIPLEINEGVSKRGVLRVGAGDSWQDTLKGLCQLQISDKKIQFLYDAAIRTVILHSVDDIYPGPYTYRRFWFRDAVFILNAMLSVGMIDRAEKMMNKFIKRQTSTGYFRSQEGEWDSNGQVLWIINRFYEMSGKRYDHKWFTVVQKAVHWIKNKRVSVYKNELHNGLLPAGFSAEHFGPNDYYYWDDIWSVAGLRGAARYFRAFGDNKKALRAEEEALDLFDATETSLTKVQECSGKLEMPSSPYRRMDSGAIGSIVSNYPLLSLEPKDKRVMATVEYLMNHCLIDNGFFHDMSHSGINPYLTLHLAQVLLRAGDDRYFDLIKAVVDLASPTGQWPEAIHPATKGGCMGDGQHVWAAAEWIMMVRNCFVREESANRLIICSGIHRDWCVDGGELSFGPAPTSYGPITITVKVNEEKIRVDWCAKWHVASPKIEVRLPGHKTRAVGLNETFVEFDRLNSAG